AHPAHELGPFDLHPGHSTGHGLQGGRMRVCRIGICVAGCRAAASPGGVVAPADRDTFVERTLTPGKQFPYAKSRRNPTSQPRTPAIKSSIAVLSPRLI